MFLTATLTEEEEQRTEPEQESDDGEEGCGEGDRPSEEEFQLLQAEKADLEQRLAEREAEPQQQTERYAQLWRLNCDQLREFDHLIEEKEAQVRELTGRVPPVDPFTGDPKGGLNFDDWWPTLERAAKWNQWTEEELLLQLAGHLQGRAFREWNLMSCDDRQSYSRAVQVMKEWVDTGQLKTSATSISVTMRQ